MGIYYGHGILDAEVGSQKSEVKGRRSDVRNQKSALCGEKSKTHAFVIPAKAGIQ